MVSEPNVKHHFLFVYEEYYPLGGADDCVAVFENEEDALAYIKKEYPRLNVDNLDLCVIKDGQLETLYYAFNVIGINGGLQRVLANDETNVIKIKAKEQSVSSGFSSRVHPIGHYKDES